MAQAMIPQDGSVPLGAVPPKPKKKRTLGKYTTEQKDEARALRRLGWSFPKISKHLGIPRTNVVDWCKDRGLGKHGRQTLLTAEEEDQLVTYLEILQKTGRGIGERMLRKEVGAWLQRANDDRCKHLKKGKPSEYQFSKFYR